MDDTNTGRSDFWKDMMFGNFDQDIKTESHLTAKSFSAQYMELGQSLFENHILKKKV